MNHREPTEMSALSSGATECPAACIGSIMMISNHL